MVNIASFILVQSPEIAKYKRIYLVFRKTVVKNNEFE